MSEWDHTGCNCAFQPKGELFFCLKKKRNKSLRKYLGHKQKLDLSHTKWGGKVLGQEGRCYIVWAVIIHFALKIEKLFFFLSKNKHIQTLTQSIKESDPKEMEKGYSEVCSKQWPWPRCFVSSAYSLTTILSQRPFM